MNAQTRQRIVLAIISLAMVWGVYNLFWSDAPKPVAPPVAAIQPTVPVTKSGPKPGKSDLERVKAAEWGADPFRTLIKRASKPADKPKEELKLILSGIVFNERSPMAVINKRTVRPGDIIDGARVVSIARKSVTVERNGRRFQLKVSKG